MRQELLEELLIVSEEEKRYRSGQENIEEQLYARESITEVEREKLLQRGRLVTVASSQPFCAFSGAQA